MIDRGPLQRLPLRPRFLRECVIIPFDEGVMVEGAEFLRILRADGRQSIWLDILSLLDGTRDVQAIVSALPDVQESHIHHILLLLQSVGLLADSGDDIALPATANRQTLAFLWRLLGITGINRSGPEAYNKLNETRLVICNASGDSRNGEGLRAMLVKAGLESVSVLSTLSLKQLEEAVCTSNKPMIVVCLSLCGEDCEWNSQVADWCDSNGARWLRVAVDENKAYADIGPLFEPKVSPCYECLRNLHIVPLGSASQYKTERSNYYPSFWIALAATELIYSLTNLSLPITSVGFRRYDLRTLESKDLGYARLPGCPRCDPSCSNIDGLAHVQTGLIEAARLYEEYLSNENRLFDGRGEAQKKMQRRFAALIAESKQLSGCAKIALPRNIFDLDCDLLGLMSMTTPALAKPITIESLSTLLELTAGVKRRGTSYDNVRRWAPTSGNLGSVELYVVVRKAQGIGPGLYFYDSGAHALAQLAVREADIDVNEFIQQTIKNGDGYRPDVLVCFTGAFHRLKKKYGSFGYKLVHLDAGVAMAQLQIVAKGLGCHTRIVPWVDELLEQYLHLVPFDEQPTGVVALSSPPPRPGMQISARSMDEFAIKGSNKACGRLLRTSNENRTKDAFEDSQRNQRSQPTSVVSACEHSIEEVRVQLSGIPLPLSPFTARSISSVFLERASVRRYSESEVPLECVSVMLHHASGQDETRGLDDHLLGAPLSFLVVAQRIKHLAPGVYRFHASEGILLPERSELRHDEMLQLFGQDEPADAPLQVWVLGNLTSECRRQGGWGHRQLLLRAGLAVQRLALTAAALGLKGSILAGIVPNAARSILKVDERHQAALVAFSAGFAGPSELEE